MTGQDNTSMGIDPLRFVARVTIECQTAVLVADGSERKAHDQGFVRDVHGLPMIPGTSLAGILSHSITSVSDLDPDALRPVVFGSTLMSAEMQTENVDDSDASTRSMASRLRVSDGYFHDASDRPVDQDLRELEEDEVTCLGRQGSHRDRVRINARGTADSRGKFDALFCPKGARFTFELEFVWGSPGEAEDEATRDPERGLAELVGTPSACPVAEELRGKMARASPKLLTFLDFPGDVDVTNNACERALRPSVIQRKVTNGFRSMWAAQGDCAVRSVTDTAKLNGHSVWMTINQTLA